jgi:hypothetical protein
VDAGAEADALLGHDLSALMWAASRANDAPEPDGVEVARLLIAAGAGIDRQEGRRKTPLIVAAARGHPQMVVCLPEAGADRGIADQKGRAAAAGAAWDDVRALLNAGQCTVTVARQRARVWMTSSRASTTFFDMSGALFPASASTRASPWRGCRSCCPASRRIGLQPCHLPSQALHTKMIILSKVVAFRPRS